MNDSRHNSHEPLDDLSVVGALATAAKLPAGAKLDGEAAELRQTWQSFGQLLETEQSTFDSRRLLTSLRSQAIAESKVESKVTRRPAESENRLTPQRSPWPWQIVTLLALVVAVGWIWYASTGRQAPPVVDKPVTPDQPIETPHIAQATPATEDPDELDYLGWDDEEFASALDTVAAGLQAAAQPASTSYHEADWLQDRFDQLQQDLNGETL